MKNKKSNIANIVKEPNIYNRTDSDVILIYYDTLKLKLKEYEDSVKFKNLSLSIFGIVLAIILTFVTTDFKNALGLSAYTWQAFFILILFALIVFSVCYVIKWLRNRTTINSILEDFRKQK